MKNSLSLLFTLALVPCLSAGCTAEQDLSESAPDVSDDTLGAEDYGHSYNGWTIWADGQSWRKEGWTDFTIGFRRTSGTQASRGGGGCLTVKTNTNCSSDLTCPGGGQGWGYCVQGKCSERPGGPEFCALGPSHPPGATYYRGVDTSFLGFTDQTYVVTCLTKTVGPNTACGGTNQSLYMRGLTFIDRGS